MAGRRLSLGSPTVQVDQVAHETWVREAFPNRSTGVLRNWTIPAIGSGDIELTVTTQPDGMIYGNKIPHGDSYISVQDDQVVIIHRNSNRFYANTWQWGNNVNRTYPTRISGAGRIGHYGVDGEGVTLDDGTILIHRRWYRQAGSIRSDWQTLTPITVDRANETVRWGTMHHIPNSNNNNTWEAEDPYILVKLDATHVGVVGGRPSTEGYQPTIVLAEYDTANDRLNHWGPFLFGGRKAMAGAINTQMYAFRIDDERLIVLWADKSENDFSGTSYNDTYRPLHAQVLGYDLTTHTIHTQGPIRTFIAGVGFDNPTIRWFPDQEIVVIVALNYDGVDYYEPTSVHGSALDYHIGARSLLVNGYDIQEGHSRLRIGAPVGPQAFDYIYSFAVVGEGDRFAVIWPDVSDLGGDLMYSKVRIGIEGSDRGALATYEQGVFWANTGLDYEMWTEDRPVVLADGTEVVTFEHYTDDYNGYPGRNVHARKVP